LAWQLALSNGGKVKVGVVSMGNPHAVQVVDDVDTAPVQEQGPLIEHHAAFPKRVNAGFMQVLNRLAVRLRVFERGAGETLACGTGACAAVVTGIRWGLLDPRVRVQTHGGTLTIEWQGGDAPVRMTGPATTVFQGEISLQIPYERRNYEPYHRRRHCQLLGQYARFFERHAELLSAVKLTSPHSHRAVSLQERQAEMMREKIRALELRMMDMMRHGTENEVLIERMQRWMKTLLMTSNARDLPHTIADHIQHDFMVPQVAIKVWGVNESFQIEPFAQSVVDAIKEFAATLSKPYVGLNNNFDAVQWLPDPAAAQSVALIALRATRPEDTPQTAAEQPVIGLLVLASPDPQRYYEGMGTTIIERMGDLASAALSHLR